MSLIALWPYKKRDPPFPSIIAFCGYCTIWSHHFPPPPTDQIILITYHSLITLLITYLSHSIPSPPFIRKPPSPVGVLKCIVFAFAPPADPTPSSSSSSFVSLFGQMFPRGVPPEDANSWRCKCQKGQQIQKTREPKTENRKVHFGPFIGTKFRSKKHLSMTIHGFSHAMQKRR